MVKFSEIVIVAVILYWFWGDEILNFLRKFKKKILRSKWKKEEDTLLRRKEDAAAKVRIAKLEAEVHRLELQAELKKNEIWDEEICLLEEPVESKRKMK